MNKQQWQEKENEYLTTLNQLAEQEHWAKGHGHHLLAKAYSEGSKVLLNELNLLQKLRAKCNEHEDEYKDFCSGIIKLKEQGYFVEHIADSYGPQFSGMYRWMNSKTHAFQDGGESYSEMEAWVNCVQANIK